jgi:hypothetical protein
MRLKKFAAHGHDRRQTIVRETDGMAIINENIVATEIAVNYGMTMKKAEPSYNMR